mmetsp:Transcript_14343/g.25790  ORF Transcript_14343/g.25790 Transcript_14343/m.25790 type:complete len:229 (+) Transcript_14343:559-1245(+)
MSCVSMSISLRITWLFSCVSGASMSSILPFVTTLDSSADGIMTSKASAASRTPSSDSLASSLGLSCLLSLLSFLAFSSPIAWPSDAAVVSVVADADGPAAAAAAAGSVVDDDDDEALDFRSFKMTWRQRSMVCLCLRSCWRICALVPMSCATCSLSLIFCTIASCSTISSFFNSNSRSISGMFANLLLKSGMSLAVSMRKAWMMVRFLSKSTFRSLTFSCRYLMVSWL